MDAFLEPLGDLEELQEAKKQARAARGIVQISGCIDAQKSHMMFALGDGFKNKIIVTFSDQRAREIYEDYRFFDRDVLSYPAKDILFYQSDIRGSLLTKERLAVLKRLANGEPATLVTTYDALMNRMAEVENFTRAVCRLSVGQGLDLGRMSGKLVQMGYVKNYQAQAPGEFALRGGILDIFPLTEENPYRIELWGDEIDSIRSFDAESQRSIENMDEAVIYPATEFVLTEEALQQGIKKMRRDAEALERRYRKEMKTTEAQRVKTNFEAFAEEARELKGAANLDDRIAYFWEKSVSLLDCFDKTDTVVYLDEPARLLEKGRVSEQEFSESMQQRLEKGYILPGQMDALYPSKEIGARLAGMHGIALAALDMRVNELEIRSRFHVQVKSVNPYNNSFELLIKDLKRYKKNGYRVILLSGSRTRAKHLAGDIGEEGLSCFYTEDYSHIVKSGEVMVCYGKVKRGFEYPMLKFVVISESDIFGGEKKKKKKRRIYEGEKIQSFSDLSVGDYVVHENHGLGIYRGIEKVEVEGTGKDYIKIEYAGSGNLYILATQLELIQKYAGSDAKKPKLNKLGSPEWNRTKTKVRGAVKEIAQELVALYAKRQSEEGFVYGPDTVWQQEFEEMFPFEETEDQLLAIEATKRDMESKKVMDRLICGDVGYGKTEIAIRAAFKAVQEGKQAVYLVPTTILAQQHYNTFTQRMREFPVRVDLLCRFRTAAEQKKTIADLKRGTVDIVIGTHRVLSKDVAFKDLGLLIIDEEQRFGVSHKEKIKQLKTNIDVLTLTATPIPRTLHMSLIGIRDMSVLEEPPMDRMAIQTYVLEYNEEMIREAISRELARGGQVYYVFNRVNQIVEMTAKIESLMPEAVVAFAHGQMREKELEDIMYRFINGEIDVLVSTTIIETGLDISNVNTMIIHDADNMGLSQLYQLRGRVGRSNRTAYAFLMYRRDKMLKEIAEKRLAAIKEFTELGSGFKIAMRDLELRGAGNLLGAQQSGHMEAVGYDLYCKMLNEAVKSAKGIAPGEQFETSVDAKIDAFIPVNYIPNEYQKLDIYKRIAEIETKEEGEEMLEELIDRFGDPPKSVTNLLLIAQLKAKAHKIFVKEVAQRGNEVKFVFYERANIDVSKIPRLVDLYKTRLKFVPDAKGPYLTLILRNNDRKDQKDDMTIMEEFLEDAAAVLL